MVQLRIGEVLVEGGVITQEQLGEALQLQRESTERKRLGEVLIDSGIISEEKMLEALSKRLDMEFVSINDQNITIDAVSRIPKSIAVKHTLLATQMVDDVLTIIINDPLDFYAIEDAKFIVAVPIKIKICKKSEITKAINYWYSEIDTKKAASSANETVDSGGVFDMEDLNETSDDTPVVTLVNSILYKAYQAGASDIHIEPFDRNTLVKIRVDGLIVDYLTLANSLHNSIVARIKILSSLDIAEKRAPQDGHFRAKLQDIEINVRVSILPTIYGEKVVMRFMSQSTTLDHSTQFGMETDDYQKMMEILQLPHGIVYITGPTGSGKTTTLYMILEMLTKRFVNIATIEDPVEKNIERVNQTQINVLAGITFESGLRALLRQDPDIIMIGETRDAETASISVRAALTGHQVLSTLHTNDAVSAIARLADMGVENYLLANSLSGVVAQRLVKKICPFCKDEYFPTDVERSVIGADIPHYYKGKGCHVCNNTGYKGRIAVHEILAIDNKIREIISRKRPSDEIYDYVKQTGKMKTLRQSLLKLVSEGTTTVEELLKHTFFIE